MTNLDESTVRGFGDEWSRFDQTGAPRAEVEDLFRSYFRVFPWERVPQNAVGFDLGCGSGRWAAFVAPRVGTLHCIDASAEALAVARRNLKGVENVQFHHASVDAIPLPDDSADFGYSLGVLHHVPDTAQGIRDCVRKLKRGAPFLVYLYYAFDNRPAWFRTVWRSSDVIRRVVSKMPFALRSATSQVLAGTIYWPMARASKQLERLGVDVSNVPLSAYRNRTFYMMRTDALDRFGTRLEQRFTRSEITKMMKQAGLGEIRFSDTTPYWCAVGIKQ